MLIATGTLLIQLRSSLPNLSLRIHRLLPGAQITLPSWIEPLATRIPVETSALLALFAFGGVLFLLASAVWKLCDRNEVDLIFRKETPQPVPAELMLLLAIWSLAVSMTALAALGGIHLIADPAWGLFGIVLLIYAIIGLIVHRLVSEGPLKRPELRLDLCYHDRVKGEGRLEILNIGTEPVFDINIHLPPEAGDLHFMNEQLPLAELPPGKSAKLYTSTFPEDTGKDHFDVRVTGRTVDGEPVVQDIFLSLVAR